MPLNIPTTKEIKDRNLANLESNLGQTAPVTYKAFLRVLAAMEAMGQTELYKYAAERTKQNLALTASGADLDTIGAEFGIIRKAAEAAILTITLPAVNGTVIPATVDYVGTLNNVRYIPTASVVASGGVATSNVVAQTLGVLGNLQVSDTMTIGTQIAGAETVATVITVVNVGAEEETDDVYRLRILFAIRSTAGGGNATDHKIWAEEVAGVARAFPYTGEPDGSPPGISASSVPGSRTVFIEADASIDPDGIPPAALLDEVRDTINTDPVTGKSRPPLGLEDSTLYVEAITRTEIFILITNFDPGTGVEATIKAEIETALTQYFLGIVMFVPAVDLPQDRNDLITKLTLSDVVQDILTANNASAELIEFGLTTGVGTPLDSYQLVEGELVKLGATGGIDYA
jgi:hypothetical protein